MRGSRLDKTGILRKNQPVQHKTPRAPPCVRNSLDFLLQLMLSLCLLHPQRGSPIDNTHLNPQWFESIASSRLYHFLFLSRLQSSNLSPSLQLLQVIQTPGLRAKTFMSLTAELRYKTQCVSQPRRQFSPSEGSEMPIKSSFRRNDFDLRSSINANANVSGRKWCPCWTVRGGGHFFQISFL